MNARRGPAWVGRISILIVFLIVVALILDDLRSGEVAAGPPVGTVLPDFAAPLATSDLEGAVNLLRREREGSPAACAVRGPRVLNICALRDRGPVTLAFFATEGDECIRQLDELERVRRRHPGVGIAAVALRGDRDETARLVRERRWGFPVGHDEEGYLASVYGVAVCPQITFARRGGEIVDTTFGELSPEELEAQVAALERPRP